jgi:hypothetical protein
LAFTYDLALAIEGLSALHGFVGQACCSNANGGFVEGNELVGNCRLVEVGCCKSVTTDELITEGNIATSSAAAPISDALLSLNN